MSILSDSSDFLSGQLDEEMINFLLGRVKRLQAYLSISAFDQLVSPSSSACLQLRANLGGFEGRGCLPYCRPALLLRILEL